MTAAIIGATNYCFSILLTKYYAEGVLKFWGNYGIDYIKDASVQQFLHSLAKNV